MKYKYVVIEREYGSGGTEIGKLLAEKTNIPCFGSEIIEKVSGLLDIPVSEIQQFEESTTNSLLYSIHAFAALGKVSDGSETFLSNENSIFMEEQKLIKEYAMQGPAIFVGRCAANALASLSKNVLTVYIHADKECRKKRAIEQYGIQTQAADSTIAKFDKKRKNYYFANTGKQWSDLNNYEIVLDSGKLGIEACADIIRTAMA